MTVELRVLSWNMHGLRDDRTALVHVVCACDPHVVCVQEAPKYLRWRARCADLARRCGLFYVTGGGTTGGSALLSGLGVQVEGQEEVCLSREWGWPALGVAAAVITRSGARLAVASMHLPLEAPQRLDHAHRVMQVLGRMDGPHTLAAGDVNERPGHAAWQALHDGGLRDLGPGSGPTFPAVSPAKRIDAVFGSEQVEVLDYRVVDEPGVERASDHRPLLVTVGVPTS